ncbi:hypothetical protein PENSPDRAFT_573097 [Peniophora sp. CONT]|nr:hypothetical protein PENSPDRAFT_573097 [Peniophora sp. CONT]
MSAPITFYDLRFKPGLPGSPNAWKTRFTLNYKGIPYKTTYLSFVEIKPALQAASVPPLEADFYTVPSIIDHATGQAISDSMRIAEYLDAQYPDTPTILPASTREAQMAFENNVRQPFAFTIFPIILMDFYNNILVDQDKEYFRRTREAQFGAPLESVVPQDAAQRKARIDVVRAGLENVAKEVAKHAGEGALFFGGDKPCFADIILAATFKSLTMGFGTEYDLCKAILSNEWAAKFIHAFDKWGSYEM